MSNEKIGHSLKKHDRLPFSIDAAGGWLIAGNDWLNIRGGYPATKEVRLSNLGKFPLPDTSLSVLNDTITINGEAFQVPDILQKSQIPLFVSASGDLYAPKVSHSIARYFYDLWFVSEVEGVDDSDSPIDDEKTLLGIGVLRSFDSRLLTK